jgi:hypothetical protein
MTPVLESRKRERLLCHSPLLGKLTVPSSAQPLDATVCNLSGTGIGFQTAQLIPVGQQVIVRLHRSPAGSVIRFSAKVAHCSQAGEHCWNIGCEFAEETMDTIVEYLVH